MKQFIHLCSVELHKNLKGRFLIPVMKYLISRNYDEIIVYKKSQKHPSHEPTISGSKQV